MYKRQASWLFDFLHDDPVVIAEWVLIALHMLSVPWDLFVQVAVCGQACYHSYIVAIAEATTGSATSAVGGDSHAGGITA